MGCNTAAIFEKSTVWLEKVNISATKDANGGAPIKCHIVVIYDDNALKVLGDKTNADYFNEVDQIKTDFRDKIQIFEFDVIPGRCVEGAKIEPSQYGGKGVIIFARYTSNDQNQKKPLGEEQIIHLAFKKETYDIITIA